jgi:hypothetical protein
MNLKPAQQVTNFSTYILSVVNGFLLRILGIQNILLVLPVHTGDKRFNQ